MSWLHSLIQTYDNCFDAPWIQDSGTLIRIYHVERQARIEIVLDNEGNFDRADIVQNENTVLPATEDSAGRTGRQPVAHPLCDKLRYVAADYDSDNKDHRLYLKELSGWASASDHPKLHSIFKYVQRGRIVEDLIEAGILARAEDGTVAYAKARKSDPGDALIRWRVEGTGQETTVWKDVPLQTAWVDYNATLHATRGLCLASGTVEYLTTNHPKGIRDGRDNAKLISSNDKSGYTFRGRFHNADEAYGLSSRATQKAHNALRWLIKRQGTRVGEMVIVAWSPGGEPVPSVAEDTPTTMRAMLGLPESENSEAEALAIDDENDAGQLHARRLRERILGRWSELRPPKNVVVLALDSASPGRMAIVYYRELLGSEFLDRIEAWHSALAWPQSLDKGRRFIGAPSPADIAKAAYGRRAEGKAGMKLQAATVARLLPCIVDGRAIPSDLVLSCTRRAANRVGLKRSKNSMRSKREYETEFEFCLGIACSVLKASRPEEKYDMSLDEERTTRSYLYGRMLAIAENIERFALDKAEETRDTSAGQLMQRFSDYPFQTWTIIAKKLQPYESRLRSNPKYAGFVESRKKLLDQIACLFKTEDFIKKSRLDGEFLLGYYCQRERLHTKSKKSGEGRDQQTLQTEGETE